MKPIEPEDAVWLTTAEGRGWLMRVAGHAASPRLVATLRKELSANRTAAVLEVAEARRRGAAKFSVADQLLLTRRGVEQATDEWIAAFKASRLHGVERVLDVGCGVGGDLMGLAAAAHEAVAMERNSALAVFAQHNAEAIGHQAVVSAEAATDAAIADCDAWHVDPDRRPGERRTIRLEASEPSLATLQRWRAITPSFAAKLAPAATPPDDWQSGCELEWISRGGECRQLVTWGGRLTEAPGARRATRVFGGPNTTVLLPVSFSGPSGVEAPRCDTARAWVFEPDSAVLAAGLVGAIAAEHQLSQLGEVAYLTGDQPIEHPLLAAFRVVEVLPLDRPRLTAWLRKRGVGRLEVKVRGVSIVPERLRRELKPQGDNALTLLVCPSPNDPQKPLVIAAERRVGAL